jgi:hypothetical protein
MFLADYVAELQAMGFDGYSPADLESYINRGYFYVARKNTWYWEQTTDAFTVVPGGYGPTLWPAASGELPQFRSLDKLYITTAGSQARLTIIDEDKFFSQWLSLDLTAAANRGTPEWYYVWNQILYVLPPPQTSTDFLAHYHRRVTAMTHATPGTSDLPITPVHLDEAILKAAKVRCHQRAQELALAQSEQADLIEVFDDMADDESEIMDELQERVEPDNSWL